MSYTLLIVDDSKLARMSAAKALNSLQPDWSRLEASNADEALSLAKNTAFDVALLDFNMPGRDGLELAAALLALRPSMPLAVVSANHQEEIVRRVREIGAAFLVKPLNEQALGAFLEDAVRRLKQAQA
ncbi:MULTISPECIES: response regulator transcription factor [unclassified Bradyrhizobium]|uniref:response regulator transcription factor n=1 Tax=unclassified Bradyrhizobium TaxID=2631580 RepID=UPI0003FDF2DF|nr:MULTISPECIES: response regulator [unclassified Bradyrhizobium]QIG97350.1 response regulator [Bradyrhizobium sp. 6(2017)]